MDNYLSEDINMDDSGFSDSAGSSPSNHDLPPSRRKRKRNQILTPEERRFNR